MKHSVIASFSGDRTSENAWLDKVGNGKFESRDRDEVTGNAGETDATTYAINDHELLLITHSLIKQTAGIAGPSNAFSFPLAVTLDLSTSTLGVVVSSCLDTDSVPGAKGSKSCVLVSVSVT